MTQNEDYRATLLVDNTPEEVFAAITNVRGWWSETIEGKTDQLGEFRHSYKDMHRCTIRITEFVPGRKVAWHVVDNYFNFVENKTELRFTHVGLVPAYECYDVCSDAWGTYINGSLRDLITRGKGQPNQKED